MSARVWVEVNLDAIRHNIQQLKARVAPSQLLVVVKSNAYGHGLLPVAQVAVPSGHRSTRPGETPQVLAPPVDHPRGSAGEGEAQQHTDDPGQAGGQGGVVRGSSCRKEDHLKVLILKRQSLLKVGVGI